MEIMTTRRGVKITTKQTYWDNFKEFYRTLERLNKFSKQQILTFPTPSSLLAVYIIDCAYVRIVPKTGKPNKWNTIRNKLCSVDHINKIALAFSKAWGDRPELEALIDYAKKNNASDPNAAALPFTKSYLITFHKRVANEILYQHSTFKTDYEKSRKKLYLTSKEELTTHKQLLQVRQTYVGALAMGVTGMRVGEVFPTLKKQKQVKYGIQLKHVQIFHKIMFKGKFIAVMNNELTDPSSLHSIKIIIQNSKMRNTNFNAFTIIGRSQHTCDPALLLFDWYHSLKLLSKSKSNSYTFTPNSYLFQAENGSPITSDKFRTIFSKLVNWLGFIHAQRLGMTHALRKRFCSQLSRHGVARGLIAYAGRWKLPEAMYIYATYQEEEMTNLVALYFRPPNNPNAIPYSYDFDAAETQYYIRTNTPFGQRLGIDSPLSNVDWTNVFK